MTFSLRIRSTAVTRNYSDPEKYTLTLNYYYYEPKDDADSHLDYTNYDTTLELIESLTTTPNLLLPEKVVEDIKLVVQWARQISTSVTD